MDAPRNNFDSRFIVLNDSTINYVDYGKAESFNFIKEQTLKGRSWHSRPYEYVFVVKGVWCSYRLDLICPSKVLDMACGANHPGYLIFATNSLIRRVIALDIDKNLITNGMDHYRAKKAIGDATQTGFKDEAFDAISCVSALEHMPNWKRCIKEMHRLLKPGGMAFVTMDISTDTIKTEKHGVDDKTPADYANEFERCGLKIFGDYDDHLPDDAVDTICSRYPLAESEPELLEGQHRALKTFRMVLRK